MTEAKYSVQQSIGDFLERDVFAVQDFGQEDWRAAPGDVTALDTRRTSTWPGYTSGGRRAGSARAEG